MRKIAGLPRPVRGGIALGIDLATCIACVWLAFSIRLGVWQLATRPVAIVIAVAIPVWLISARTFGIYRSIIRTSGSRALLDLASASSMYALPMIVVFMFVGVWGVPRTVGILQPLLFLLALSITRIVIRHLLIEVLQRAPRQFRKRRVAIYGAGNAGQQLGLALRHEGTLDLVAYIDDNPSLVGHRIDGVAIFGGNKIGDLAEKYGVEEMLLAMPRISRSRRLRIVEQMAGWPMAVRSLPTYMHIIDGKVSTTDLREIRLDELLGRDPVAPDEVLLEGAITGHDVLVSGAGGSIGSELCRQIAIRRPRKLILADQSEFALYHILNELEQITRDCGTKLVGELVDVSNRPSVRRVMARNRPDTVFHAAAYKHVPLVEDNPISGLRNNVFGTLYCCLEAEESGASRFVLISTDKAVRPTNVMGASKRICELILQARARTGTSTVFSMVRFGNVLGSSGSVVPRFQTQIARGGPVTLTSREITRFLMTIPEAAELVLQAGAMAVGGDVFVLEMGQPVRIYDLARTMIQLSGYAVRDEANPEGDISIIEVGLRPGEKMYEELLLGGNPQPTRHDRILRAQEDMIPWNELKEQLVRLELSLAAGDLAGAMTVVRQCVPEYSPELQAAKGSSATVANYAFVSQQDR